MNIIKIENINKVIYQLTNYNVNIKREVWNQIVTVGNRIVQELQIKYPDLSFSSNLFPEQMEYWIHIWRAGRKLTDIKCPISNLFFTRKRDEFGKQEFKSTVPELNIDELIKHITEELSLQLNAIVGRKV